MQPFTELMDVIHEDWTAHGRDWTRPGFRALAVYRLGAWKNTIESRMVRAPISFLHRFLFRRMRNVYGIELPFSAQIGRRVIFEHQGGVVVHGAAVIGNGCIIRQGVTIGMRHLEAAFDAPRLGNSVSIGAGAAILGKLTVGDGANIGANSVVLEDVPKGATAVGVPARIILAEDDRLPIRPPVSLLFLSA